jgi:hypothetical protein
VPDTPATNDQPSRVAVLEEIAGATKAAIDRLDRRIETVERRLDGIAAELRDVRNRQDRDFRWLIGLYLAGYASLLGVMAHGFHWL